MLPFCDLFVPFAHCAQMAEDIDAVSFAYDSPMFHSDRVIIWFILLSPLLPKLFPKVLFTFCQITLALVIFSITKMFSLLIV